MVIVMGGIGRVKLFKVSCGWILWSLSCLPVTLVAGYSLSFIQFSSSLCEILS